VHPRFWAPLLAAAAVGSASLAAAQSAPSVETDSARYAALARHLLVNGYRVKPEDKVLISGGAHTLPLIEALALEVLRAGGDAYTSIVTEPILRYTHYDMPMEDLGRPPNKLDEALRLHADLEIRLPTTTDYFGLHSAMAPERRERENASDEQWDALDGRSRRKVVFVALPGDRDTAGTGLDAAGYRDLWFRAAMADYGRMHELGEAVRRRLASAKRVRITSPEGTDLTFEIGKPPVIDAGPRSAESQGKSARQRQTALPAGIVAVVPVEATVNGVLKAARDQCDSMVVNEVIELRRGAPVSVRAATQEDCVRQSLTERDRVGYISIGLNPAIKPMENNGAYFVNDRGLGLITVNFGDNRRFGGSNQAGNWFVALAGATLEADGRAIVRDGRILESETASTSAAR
jgi:aminopeptidase